MRLWLAALALLLGLSDADAATNLVGPIQTYSCAAHTWANALALGTGATTCTEPAYSDLSGVDSAVAQEENARVLSVLNATQTGATFASTLAAQAENARALSHARAALGSVMGSGRTTSSTSDSPTVGDCGTTITYTAATAIAVTLPATGMNLTGGGWCHIAMLQSGAGKVTPTISAAAPKNAHSYTGSAGQNAFIGVSTPDGGANWYLSGDGS